MPALFVFVQQVNYISDIFAVRLAIQKVTILNQHLSILIRVFISQNDFMQPASG